MQRTGLATNPSCTVYDLKNTCCANEKNISSAKQYNKQPPSIHNNEKSFIMNLLNLRLGLQKWWLKFVEIIISCEAAELQ
jgi:hypothetical protein